MYQIVKWKGGTAGIRHFLPYEAEDYTSALPSGLWLPRRQNHIPPCSPLEPQHQGSCLSHNRCSGNTENKGIKASSEPWVEGTLRGDAMNKFTYSFYKYVLSVFLCKTPSSKPIRVHNKFDIGMWKGAEVGGVSGNTSALLRWSLGEATWFLPGSLVPHGGHTLTDLLLNPFQSGWLSGGRVLDRAKVASLLAGVGKPVWPRGHHDVSDVTPKHILALGYSQIPLLPDVVNHPCVPNQGPPPVCLEMVLLQIPLQQRVWCF